MANKAYEKYFPKPEKKVKVQVQVRESVATPANEIREQLGLTQVELIEGLLQKFVDDNKK